MRDKPPIVAPFLVPPVLALLLLAAPAPGREEPPAVEPIPEEQLGLSKTSVFEVPAPDPVHAIGGDPGEAPPLARAYAGAPPRVPHAIDDFLPITRTDNLCLDCHSVEEKSEGEPTPIPASHKTDLRGAPSEVREEVVGARHFCATCHVPRTDARPLAGSAAGE